MGVLDPGRVYVSELLGPASEHLADQPREIHPHGPLGGRGGEGETEENACLSADLSVCLSHACMLVCLSVHFMPVC